MTKTFLLIGFFSFLFFTFGLNAKKFHQDDNDTKKYVIECGKYKTNDGLNGVSLDKKDVMELTFSDRASGHKEVFKMSGSVSVSSKRVSVPESDNKEYLKLKEVCDYLDSL